MLIDGLRTVVGNVSREVAAYALALAERVARALGMPTEAADAVWRAYRRVKVRDNLTGLLWRLEWERRAQCQLSDTPPEEKAAVLLVDVDALSQCNRDHGHVAGDAYLRELARFLIYVGSGLNAEALARDVCKRVPAAPQVAEARSLTVTVTATYMAGGTSLAAGLRLLDIAMHDAKHDGGNQVRWT
jgi:GGDEF domain-containing protein